MLPCSPLPAVRLAHPEEAAAPHLGVRPLVVAIASIACSIVVSGCGAQPAQGPTDPTSVSTHQEPGEGDRSDEVGRRGEADGPGEVGGPGEVERLDALPPLHPAIDDLDETIVTLTTPTGAVEVRAKVAVSGADRARGLMEVTDLPDGAGMLFLFDRDRTGGFWMWNTVIPLDIAFAGDEGVVHTTATMTPCEAERSTQCPITAPAEPYRSALEVPAGWLERVGVGTGAVMTWTTPVPDAG